MMADVSNGATYYGFKITVSSDADRRLYSSEAARNEVRPQLEVEWSKAPYAPTNLAPSDGRAVSEQKPMLNWKFKDDIGDTTQAHSQVQISTSTDFSSPEYDSTKVSNTESQWDLASTAYAGLSDSDVRFWRVRVWDGAGLQSEWSDIEEFTRKTKGTLTITAPAASPNNYVVETTPPLSWTFTGRTQERAEVYLSVELNNGTFLQFYRFPDVDTDTSVTVPSGLLVNGLNYKVTIRVFDTIDRQAVPGDKDYVEASREFDYQRDGTPDAPGSLTAVADGPAVVLTWTRTVQPDFFCLVVDGKEVNDRIEPTDVFVSGTTYSYTYWEATPGTESTYEIEAVVTGSGKLKHSDGNPTVDVTTTPYAIYLVDIDDGTNVMIAGDESADLTIGESGETFNTIGSRAPIRITDNIRGYEGTISGELLSEDDRDTFLELKGRLTTLHLIVGDLNIPVFLEEVSVAPDPTPGNNRFPVSFSVFQSGKFPIDLVGG